MNDCGTAARSAACFNIKIRTTAQLAFCSVVFLIAISLLFSANAANACIMFRQQNIYDVRAADLALVGYVTGFEYPIEGPYPHGAILTVETIFPIKGPWRPEQKLLWSNSTFRISNKWQGEGPVFIAAVYGDHTNDRQLTDKFVFGKSDIPIVLQPNCSSPFVFEAGSSRSYFSIFLIRAEFIFAIAILLIITRLYVKRRTRQP